MIHSLSSDLELDIEFLRELKHRQVSPKFLCKNEGASLYYLARDAEWEKSHRQGNNVPLSFPFAKDVFLEKDKHTALISLFCDTYHINSNVLQGLKEEGYDIHYFGVDPSWSMLERLQKELTFAKDDSTLLFADYESNTFQKEIHTFVQDYDMRVYALFDFTLGNTSQSHMVDTLYNILKPGDILWFDILVREEPTKACDDIIKNNFSAYLQNDLKKDFYLHSLTSLGVTEEDGKMTMSGFHEPASGVFGVRFSFHFSKPVTINYRGETIHFVPEEEVALLDIRLYHPETMIKFFEMHNFKLLGKKIVNKYGQFAFQKVE